MEHYTAYLLGAILKNEMLYDALNIYTNMTPVTSHAWRLTARERHKFAMNVAGPGLSTTFHHKSMN